MTEIDSLQKVLGIAFQNVSCLETALVHRSYLNEAAAPVQESNERLEFLGDALLGAAVSDELYRRFPDSPEGDLTRLRSVLVQTETLARVAGSLNLGRYLLMGKGEEESGGRGKQRNLACVLEAIIGAVFIDQGFGVVRDFVLRILEKEFETVSKADFGRDAKTKLQELMQARNKMTPVYRTIDSSGPDHDRIFTVEVFAGESLLGRGAGTSKQRAEQEAAGNALKELEGEGFV